MSATHDGPPWYSHPRLGGSRSPMACGIEATFSCTSLRQSAPTWCFSAYQSTGRPHRLRQRLLGPNVSSATDFLAWYERWLDHMLDGRDNRDLELTSPALRTPLDRAKEAPQPQGSVTHPPGQPGAQRSRAVRTRVSPSALQWPRSGMWSSRRQRQAENNAQLSARHR